MEILKIILIAVREHSDTRTDENVNERPIVGHLLTLFHW